MPANYTYNKTAEYSALYRYNLPFKRDLRIGMGIRQGKDIFLFFTVLSTLVVHLRIFINLIFTPPFLRFGR